MLMRISHEGLREHCFAVLSITGVDLRVEVYVRLDECLQYDGLTQLRLIDFSELMDPARRCLNDSMSQFMCGHVRPSSLLMRDD